jgi:hypothetical protein
MCVFVWGGGGCFNFDITQKNMGLEEQLKALQKETKDMGRMKEVRIERV